MKITLIWRSQSVQQIKEKNLTTLHNRIKKWFDDHIPKCSLKHDKDQCKANLKIRGLCFYQNTKLKI